MPTKPVLEARAPRPSETSSSKVSGTGPLKYSATDSSATSYVEPAVRRTIRSSCSIGAIGTSRWSFSRTLTHAAGSTSGAPVTATPSRSRTYDSMYALAAYDAASPSNAGVRATHEYVAPSASAHESAHTYASLPVARSSVRTSSNSEVPARTERSSARPSQTSSTVAATTRCPAGSTSSKPSVTKTVEPGATS